MTIRKTKETPWRLLLALIGVEVLIALSFPAAYALRVRQNYLYLVLEYLANFLHASVVAVFAVIALWRATHRGIGRAVGLVGVLIAAMTVKDFFGCFFEQLLTGSLRVSGCLLLALRQSLLGTALVEGGLILLAFGFSYYVFLSRRPPAPPYAGAFTIRGNDLTAATLLFVSLMTLRSFVSQLVTTIWFGNEYFWLLRTSEILGIVLDFAMLFLIGFVSYLLAGETRRRFLDET